LPVLSVKPIDSQQTIGKDKLFLFVRCFSQFFRILPSLLWFSHNYFEASNVQGEAMPPPCNTHIRDAVQW
jgi:hypothetical protein